MVERIDTLVVGAGQAGIAMSEHLGTHGIPHLVLERARIAEAWRTARWDRLVTNGPAWHDRFPNMVFPETGPDGFPDKAEVARYFEDYARMINAPLRTGVDVQDVRRCPDQPGFAVQTSAGPILTQNIVAATGPFQKPVIPKLIPPQAPVAQIHSSAYRNPDQLDNGAVLVVGAGSSGAQIADELQTAGRKVFLSVGPHDRPPRRYRGRDFVWWLGVLGKWDAPAPGPGTEHVTIAVSGADGGFTVDFRRFARRGMTLLGMTEGYADGTLSIAGDLARNIARSDVNYLALLDEADAFITRNGLDLPPEPEARRFDPDPDCLRNPLRQLDLTAQGITTVIWATGFAPDYSWLQVDAFSADCKPRHQRGVSPERGVYFLGLPWQSRRGSSFIWGVWHDAKFIADQIAIQRAYTAYRPAGGSSGDRSVTSHRCSTRSTP